MFVPKKMRVNSFIATSIPDNKAYFARLGTQSMNLASQYSGDVVPDFNLSKIESLCEVRDEILNLESNNAPENV